MINAASIIRLFLVLGLFLTTACNNWRAADSFQEAVFSSAGNGLAGVHAFYDAKCNVWSGCNATYTRGHTYQVWAQPTPTVDTFTSFIPNATSARFDGRVESVVYVNTDHQRYVLVKSIEEAGYRDTWSSTAPTDETPTYTIRQFQVTENGQSITSSRVVFTGKLRRYENCVDGNNYSNTSAPLHAYASRDGNQIALLKELVSCSGLGVELQILDASTLEVLAQESWNDSTSNDDYVSARYWPSGWIDLPSTVTDDDLSAMLVQRIETEVNLYNLQITNAGYFESASAFVQTEASLLADESPRSFFVLNGGNSFDGSNMNRIFEWTQSSLVSVDLVQEFTAVIDRGALKQQLRSVEGSGAFLKDTVRTGRRWQTELGAADRVVTLNRDLEIAGYHAVANEPRVDLRVDRAWSIDRGERARQNGEMGLHSKTFWIVNADSNNRVLRGQLQCISTREMDENNELFDGTSCIDYPSDNEALNMDPDWPYTDLAWDGLRWADLHWGFDATGAARICEVQAASEADLDALVVDRENFDSGCNGQPWKTIVDSFAPTNIDP